MYGGNFSELERVVEFIKESQAKFIAKELPDGNEKPGEELRMGLCRICNEQPELLLSNDL